MLQEPHKLKVYATRHKLEVYATRHKLEVYATRKRHFQLEMVLVANCLIFLQKKYRVGA